MRTVKKEYTIKSDWLGDIRKGSLGKNMTATQVMEQDYIDDAVKRASKRLAEEIDFQIVADMLVSTGWEKVVLKPMTHEKSDAIDIWTATNCNHDFKNMGLVWIFKDRKDAVNFVLRWAN